MKWKLTGWGITADGEWWLSLVDNPPKTTPGGVLIDGRPGWGPGGAINKKKHFSYYLYIVRNLRKCRIKIYFKLLK